MKTHRVKIWEQVDGATVMTAQASELITRRPCLVKTYDLAGTDGKKAAISVFPMELPPLVLIEPQSPPWAEGAIARLFNADGTKNQKWALAE